ncbi:minichromosome maintenance protein MCM (plasmid) [Methanosphaera sp. ISO3-F5]|uniref:minichromosome maintenance protein MCM n=1 Tax=Methanosphaera sp. ISO3-F5 TaxID=1452353 RepID=UPI002B25B3FE|nr:minichromosome maintenance protein MCM [Methanosphaera sp. ISO3-F5]WQH65351.1 minichromosome maintenance protein MCM [Methanosphaera sp. ISO3-F5]
MIDIDYERIDKILNKYYKKELVSKDETINLDYTLIDTYYPELTENLEDNYKMIIKTLQRYLKKIRIQHTDTTIKFINVKHKIKLEHIHQRYNNKWISFEGIVKKRSIVYNQITRAHWTCTYCGVDNIYPVEDDEKLKMPKENCKNCGRRKGYTLNKQDSQYEDKQLFILEEDQNNTDTIFQPTQVRCYLKDEMINSIKPGDKITVNGIVKLENNNDNNHFNEYVTITAIEKSDKNYEDLNITEQEKKQIKKLAKQSDIYTRITSSIIPSMYGYKQLKLALALHLFSSPNHQTHDGSYKRGDIHILLIGDPSVGKSQILKYVSKISPHGIYTSGKGSSGAGLTATTVKDEQGNWSLEAGAMVLANQGNICIDEFDKMKEDDRSAIHEALEQQTISISKAGINTTLNSRCSVLAAANPKYGRFDTYKNLTEQLNLSPPILSRFDLIFILIDNINHETDEQIAMKILNTQENPDITEQIPADLLKKYISLARTINPELDEEVKKHIAEFFCKTRQLAQENNHPIPITTRQLEAIIRLSKASARIRLSDKVTVKDAQRAMKLQEYCMKHIGFDSETSTLEADKIMGNTTMNDRRELNTIQEQIRQLSLDWGEIPEHILYNHLKLNGHSIEKIRKTLENQNIYHNTTNNTYTVKT